MGTRLEIRGGAVLVLHPVRALHLRGRRAFVVCRPAVLWRVVVGKRHMVDVVIDLLRIAAAPAQLERGAGTAEAEGC
jgi:hypothetical protein